VHVL
jgi:hypothetical protein